MNVPNEISSNYQRMLKDGSALTIQQRLAAKDVSLWSNDPTVQQNITQRLGWIDCIDMMLAETEAIRKIKNELLAKGFRHCVLLGMGGSSLAPELFSQLFSHQDQSNRFTLEVADNTSPDAIEKLTCSIDHEKTIFIVASKSGTTIESDSLYRYFYNQLIKADISNPGKQFIAITDPDTDLNHLAEQNDFFHCFINPSDIGGRFSVLSFFGLVPAALLDIDIVRLLKSAKSELKNCFSEQQVSRATKLGLILSLSAEQGLDKLFIELDPKLLPFAVWLEQLIAESTGKASKGILPVIEIREDFVDQSKDDFQFKLADRITEQEIQPVCSQSFDLTQIGAEFFKWEWATAIAGAMMAINPFDEPNVGENKKITVKLLEANSDEPGNLSDISDSNTLIYQGPEDLELLQNKLPGLIKNSLPTDYFAILMYCVNGVQTESFLLTFRNKLKDKYKIPSTFAVGPRYLHSTGQLHKGGANNGIFLIITTEFNHEQDIPGKTYNFGQLNRAQAIGDIQALQSKQRKLLHIHLNGADDQLLETFCDALTQSLG